MKHKLSWLLALAMAAGLAGCAGTPKPPVFSEAFTPIDAFAQTAEMHRGVNVLGYDPVWSDPAKARFTPATFAIIRNAGFDTVRVVLQSFRHMDAHNRLDPQWVKTLDTMVKAALANGLTVILDEHDFNLCSDDVKSCRVRLAAFWRQIAPRYADAPNRVLFEMLNEPHGQLTPAVWNDLLRRTLALIRTSNPTRNIVIGPAGWNGLNELPHLDLPDDPHIIVTFHYYNPMTFTHQGATWVSPEIEKLHDVSWGTPADYARLNADFDTVKAWGEAHHRPIFLGEFGAFDKAPMRYRVLWDSAVARAAEAHGFAWSYWQFASDFTLYDFSTKSFVTPILHALVPPPGS